MNFSTYAYPDDLTPRVCHKCSHPHPLDVISFISHCPCAYHIISSFIQPWLAPFNHIVSVWWSACLHLGDKRNFAKMFVASSLHETMTAPAQGESKPQCVLAFKNALPQRQRKLTDALSNGLTWLAKDPPPRPHPPPKELTRGESPTAPTAPQTRHLSPLHLGTYPRLRTSLTL